MTPHRFLVAHRAWLSVNVVTPHVSFQIPVVCAKQEVPEVENTVYIVQVVCLVCSCSYCFASLCRWVLLCLLPSASSPEVGHRESPRSTVTLDKVMCSVLFLMLQFVRHITKVCPHGVIKGTAISLRLGSQTEKC